MVYSQSLRAVVLAETTKNVVAHVRWTIMFNLLYTIMNVSGPQPMPHAGATLPNLQKSLALAT